MVEAEWSRTVVGGKRRKGQCYNVQGLQDMFRTFNLPWDGAPEWPWGESHNLILDVKFYSGWHRSPEDKRARDLEGRVWALLGVPGRHDRARTMVVALEAVKQHLKQITMSKATRNCSYYATQPGLIDHTTSLSSLLRFRNILAMVKKKLSFGYLLANVCFAFSFEF